MRQNSVMRSSILTLLVAGLAACENSNLTAPATSATGAASADRGAATTPASPTTTRPTTGTPSAPRPVPTPAPTRPTPKRPTTCSPDTGLTQEQIAKIRALQQAYNEAVAEDLRYIAQIEAEARAAAQAGAPRERIEAILAQADRAKAHVAELQQRLRQAINDVLTDDQRRCVVLSRKTV